MQYVIILTIIFSIHQLSVQIEIMFQLKSNYCFYLFLYKKKEFECYKILNCNDLFFQNSPDIIMSC